MDYDQKTCSECKRHLANVPNPVLRRTVHGPLVKVYVVHRFFGCDTGCEGHTAIAEDAEGNICESKFEFDAPYGESHKEFAKEFARSHFPGVPLDYGQCRVVS